MSSGDVGLDVALRTAVRTDLYGSWEVALGLSSRVTSASPIRHNDLFAEDAPGVWQMVVAFALLGWSRNPCGP
jgi:hypothetical protein